MKHLFVLVLILPFAFTSCSKEEILETTPELNILGTWEHYQEYSGDYGNWYEECTFNEDGTGYHLFKENRDGEYREGNSDFTYVIDGKNITFTVIKENGVAVEKEPVKEEIFFTFDQRLVFDYFGTDLDVYTRKK